MALLRVLKDPHHPVGILGEYLAGLRVDEILLRVESVKVLRSLARPAKEMEQPGAFLIHHPLPEPLGQHLGDMIDIAGVLVVVPHEGLRAPEDVLLGILEIIRRLTLEAEAEDIRDARGNLIAAKGQRFNPLRVVGMAHAFAFVDGDNSRELAWAMKQGAPDKLWIVLVNGSPTDRMKELQRRFYFDQQGVLTSRFGIEHTPALLTQKGEALEIREVALPHTGGLQ